MFNVARVGVRHVCFAFFTTMNAQVIVVKLNTVGHMDNRHEGPETIDVPHDIRPLIQQKFDTILKGIAGYVLVCFDGRLWQAERPELGKPYVRYEVTYHPLAKLFFTNQNGE
jgi:hypothetical protein